MTSKIKVRCEPDEVVRGRFLDSHGIECSIIESSSAIHAAIWLGTDNPNPRRHVGNRWEPVTLAVPVLIHSQMHLDWDEVRQIAVDFEVFLRLRRILPRRFTDLLNIPCSIRMEGNNIRLGIDDPQPIFLGPQGWCDVEYPAGTVFTTHMILNHIKVIRLLKILKRFLKTTFIRE